MGSADVTSFSVSSRDSMTRRTTGAGIDTPPIIFFSGPAEGEVRPRRVGRRLLPSTKRAWMSNNALSTAIVAFVSLGGAACGGSNDGALPDVGGAQRDGGSRDGAARADADASAGGDATTAPPLPTGR